METIFRKVSVNRRLPKDEYPVPVIVRDDRGVDYYDTTNYEDDAWNCILEGHHVMYWLEEIELPSDEQIEKQFPHSKNESEKKAMYNRRKGAKWMRDKILEN